jgi:hypothetical protein
VHNLVIPNKDNVESRLTTLMFGVTRQEKPRGCYDPSAFLRVNGVLQSLLTEVPEAFDFTEDNLLFPTGNYINLPALLPEVSLKDSVSARFEESRGLIFSVSSPL